MSKNLISVIIPTYNNPEFLDPCVQSIAGTGLLGGLGELVIVNNGKQPIKEQLDGMPNVRVLEPGENLGWERGLQYGLDHSDSDFVCFQNDDTVIPPACSKFYQNLLTPFANANVGAVGPSTTTAAGWHSIFMRTPVRVPMEVSYLIFFTVMLKRRDLEAAGGIDTTCPGGDDLDLSIRLRKAGKKLLISPSAFLIHHGFKTGERVRGKPEVSGGWNSTEMRDRTNQWLIRKHGFKTYVETMRGLDYSTFVGDNEDREGDLIRGILKGEKVLELGCGFRRTVPHAVGVDRVENGQVPPHLKGGCVADVQADVTEPLPFKDLSQDAIIARHILEHCIDPIETLRNWNKVLKIGGQIVIAVPDQRIGNMIPLNPEHVHAFTPAFLKNLMATAGFEEVAVLDPKNGISFIGVFEKLIHIGVLEPLEVAHA